MRKKVLLFALTSILMSLCIPASAQETVIVHIDDRELLSDSVVIFNSAKFDGNEFTSVEDLVRKLPGAEMQDDGSVTINGKDITRILVNGKPYKVKLEHEYVDLGLSVKWASCNLGAVAPEEYGFFYAWGETEPIKEMNIEKYKFSKGDHYSFTKYCTDKKYGHRRFTDNMTTLEPEDDVANVMWGGDWRIPTADECQELIDNCTCTWDSINGVRGVRFTSNVPGYTDRSIFLPAAGGDGILIMGGDGKSGIVHYIGNYWSSTLNNEKPDMARGLSIYRSEGGYMPSDKPIVIVSGFYRESRRSVRAVCQ